MWYYAGSYKGFRLDDLSIKEWAQLSPEVQMSIYFFLYISFFETFLDYIRHRERNALRKKKLIPSEHI